VASVGNKAFTRVWFLSAETEPGTNSITVRDDSIFYLQQCWGEGGSDVHDGDIPGDNSSPAKE